MNKRTSLLLRLLSPKQTHLSLSEIYVPDNIFLQAMISLAWFWTKLVEHPLCFDFNQNWKTNLTLIKNRHRKVFNTGLCVCWGVLDILQIYKTHLIFSVSYFKLWIRPKKATRREGTALIRSSERKNFFFDVIISQCTAKFVAVSLRSLETGQLNQREVYLGSTTGTQIWEFL